MDEKIIGRLSDFSTWTRLFFTIIFMIANNLAQQLLIVTGLLQYICTIVSGTPNQNLQDFVTSLTQYGYQMTKYFNLIDEEKPFPFAPWPK